MDCQTAVERLMARRGAPGQEHPDQQSAIDHICQCPRCGNRLEYLVCALATDEPDRLVCRQCQDRLPEYVEAERMGQAEGVQWRPILLHLETCPHCSAAYVELKELLKLSSGGCGREPARSPVPDLSFLGSDEDPLARAWRLDDLGRLIVAFSAELLRTLQPPAYATAGLKSAGAPGTLFQLALKESIEDLEVSILADEERGDPSLCTLSVRVNIPSRGGWPHLAGTEVSLRQDERKIDVQWTDAHGEAVFERIAVDRLPHLVFEITPPG